MHKTKARLRPALLIPTEQATRSENVEKERNEAIQIDEMEKRSDGSDDTLLCSESRVFFLLLRAETGGVITLRPWEEVRIFVLGEYKTLIAAGTVTILSHAWRTSQGLPKAWCIDMKKKLDHDRYVTN